MTSHNPLRSLPLVCFGYHPWSQMWKRNQSMTAELARQGCVERLLFLNPEVELVTSPAQVVRDCRSVRRFSWTGIIPRRPEPRVTVMTPVHWVPLRGRLPAAGRLDRRFIRAAVDRALGGRRPYVLLINTIRAETQELVELLWDDACLTVFDWSDDFSRFAHGAELREAIARTTDDLMRRVDLVLTVNEQLTDRARRQQNRVRTIINATNMRPRPAGHPLPAAVQTLARSLAGPVLGYAGFINQHRIDLELVGELARRQPECILLFIGPIRDDFRRRFPSLPNIRFLPPVPYDALQDYLALFDVCLIPHLDNPHTAGNNPLKLYDYLTTGKPIVATRVQGMEGFEDVVTVAPDREAFLAGVAGALAVDPPERVAARQARAAAQHWSIRTRDAALAIEEALAASDPVPGRVTGDGTGGPDSSEPNAPQRAIGA